MHIKPTIVHMPNFYVKENIFNIKIVSTNAQFVQTLKFFTVYNIFPFIFI